LLNVLEHIGDDEAAAFHIARVLKPGGSVVIEVPAGPELFDDYDRQLQHFRRYTLDGLCALVKNAGLVVERRNYLGSLIYPAFRLAKLRPQNRKQSPAEIKGHVEKAIRSTTRFNAIGHMVMAVEAALRNVIEFPKGIRCIVTARKPL
jgi:SAM-dependent methyltransferase